MRSDHRERELHERSPDARERRLNVFHTSISARSPDVRERSLSLIFLLAYFITYLLIICGLLIASYTKQILLVPILRPSP